MMRDETALAAINLHAVLRNMEDLCEIDPESKFIIQGKRLLSDSMFRISIL